MLQPVKGKKGYYPCDYAMYRKVKALHAAYMLAIQQAANWRRWHAKKEENRLVRVREKVDGRVRVKLVLPKPEPSLVPLFNTKDVVTSFYDRNGQYVPGGFQDEKVGVCDLGVLALYAAVRKPKRYQKNVPDVAHTKDEINEMYAKVVKWRPANQWNR